MVLKTSPGSQDVTSDRIYSIPSGTAFLPVFAKALVKGDLIDGFRPIDDPLLLPTATIYLPTRRAAHALGTAIIDAMGTNAALLPVIRTLGDDDENEFEIASASGEGSLGDPIGALERQLHLAMLVRGWTNAISQSTRELFGDEDIVIPSSSAEAMHLAGDLARLFDQMETEEISWAELLAFAVSDNDSSGRPQAWAEWWNLTLHFLRIVSDAWPAYLRERELMDPSERRGKLLDLRTGHYRESGSRGPVVAAGSTGSIPATARLLKQIASMPNGAVVLPGLDYSLSENCWELLQGKEAGPDGLQESTHPQAALAALLKAMGTTRENVTELDVMGADLANRMTQIGQALLPAEQTSNWHRLGERTEEFLSGISVLEAANEREEALCIAIVLREVLENPGKTAFLVTPDRTLARRVSSELARFDIAVDDSGGVPLSSTTAGVFARLVLESCLLPPDPVALTTLIKHELLAAEDRAITGRTARLFELAVLRDALIVPRPGELEQASRDAHMAIEEASHSPIPVRQMTDTDWRCVSALAAWIDTAFSPLTFLRDESKSITLSDGLARLNKVLLDLAPGIFDDTMQPVSGAKQLSRLLEDSEALSPTGFVIQGAELPDVFKALCDEITVRQPGQVHPRISIFGPLEARLQTADRVVLGGLNEGSWPAQTRNDPFLNRPMKAALGMSLPERRVGQAAHDFQQLSGHPEVVYTRALRADNAPTIASRWLQRLLASAGGKAAQSTRKSGARYVQLARMIDKSENQPARLQRPNPKPAIELRPKGLSITAIETWIRDPYAIYARHILGLNPLPPLLRSADPRLRGELYHDIFERFTRQHRKGADAPALLEETARAVFAEHRIPGEITAIWLRRFVEIGALFLDWEENRAPQIDQSLVEKSGKVDVEGSGFRLRGRADRIDILRNGSLAVIDYKTGVNPSAKQARTLSPQLALEGKMAQLGAFDLPAGLSVSDLAYVRLRRGEKLQVDHICEGREPIAPADLIDSAWQQLQELILAYRKTEQGYLSRRAPFREGDVSGDYDHLARVREWMIDDESGGGDG